MNKFKITLLQTRVFADKAKALEQAARHIERAAGNGADMVTLPEMFSCPYKTSYFPEYAEPEGGHTWRELSRLAGQYGIYLSAGSVPERDGAGRIYNTAYVFDRRGEQIAKHRKLHLFDIDIKGGQTFKESDTLSAGDRITVFDTEYGKMGLCICYDLRFPELIRLMALMGAKVILVPAAFNMTTGPAHWETLFRGRAVDNQVFIVGTSPARDAESEYISWGHSIIASPWGEVAAQLDEKEGSVSREIDLEQIERVREQLPLLRQRRTDIYKTQLL